VKHGEGSTNLPELSLLAINLPSQPFLGRHLGIHIFFYNGLLGGHALFYSLVGFLLAALVLVITLLTENECKRKLELARMKPNS